MMETLYLRLGTQATDKVSWLITNDQHTEIIASGELPSAAQLTQLSEKAQGRSLVALVNSNAVKMAAIKVPGRSKRAIEQAAPYMIEDDVAQDVDDLFFAFADKPREFNGEENCFFVAVQRDLINTWQSWLGEAGLFCQRIIPDVLALPHHQSGEDDTSIQWSALAFDNDIILRQNSWQGCVLDKGIKTAYLTHYQAQNQAASNESEQEEDEVEQAAFAVHHYTPMVAEDFAPLTDVQMHHQPEELPLFVLAKGARSQSFNLLQGEFQVKKKTSPLAKNWLLVAGIAVFALLLNLTYKGLLLMKLDDQYVAINQQITKTYKKAFPKTKRVQVGLLRTQIKQKLQEYNGGADGQGFLAMLDDIRPAFKAHQNIKPQLLKYDAKRGEIRLNIAAENYLAFDRFKSSLEQEKLMVTTGAQNNQGDEVTGSFTIRYN